MATISGRDEGYLRCMAGKLARQCYFRDNVLARSSPSGRGGGTGQVLDQLDVIRMNQIKAMIKSRARHRSDLEFEGVWVKCVGTISKKCQNLRNGRLTRHIF